MNEWNDSCIHYAVKEVFRKFFAIIAFAKYSLVTKEWDFNVERVMFDAVSATTAIDNSEMLSVFKKEVNFIFESLWMSQH